MKTSIKMKGEKKKRFGTNIVLKNFSYVIFLAVLGIIYIGNSQRGERKLISIQKLEKQVQESRWEYTGLKKDLMEKSSPSRLAKDLEGEVVFPEKGPRILKAPKS